MDKIVDNCTIICFFPWIHSGFVYFLFVVDWKNEEGATYNTSLRGTVINPQLLMTCPGSSNETLTAVRFQTHQMPTMKCSENMGACYDCQSCICLALGSLTSPLELLHHALTWQDFYRQRKIILLWDLCPSWLCSPHLYGDHVFAHSSSGTLHLLPESKFRVFIIHSAKI